jgi:hypothetical protein
MREKIQTIVFDSISHDQVLRKTVPARRAIKDSTGEQTLSSAGSVLCEYS